MMCKHDDDFSWVAGRKWVESLIDIELVKHVFELSDESRVKLLAFLHLVEDSCQVETLLDIGKDGRITLSLSGRQDHAEGSTPDHGSAAEPLR